MNAKNQDADNLFDTIKKEGRIKSDAALARSLGMHAPTITNMRAGRLEVGATIIVKIMEEYGLTLPRIRRLLAGVKD